jgi:hypothetical protein
VPNSKERRARGTPPSVDVEEETAAARCTHAGNSSSAEGKGATPSVSKAAVASAVAADDFSAMV